MNAAIEIGAVFEHDYPFVAETYDTWISGDEFARDRSWKPGVRFEPCGPEDEEAFADGIGKQVLRVIDIHKPGSYPARVFYVRQWVGPDGRSFGKSKLRITALSAFRRILGGYRYEFKTAPASITQKVES